MTITFKDGDILNANETIICHQVNCQGVMGAGLAKQIRDNWYNVYTEYKEYCSTRHASLGKVLLVSISDNQYVANLFGQLFYGTDKRYTDYYAVRKCLNALYTILVDIGGGSLAIPYKMGCNLGGGDWNIVYSIIEEIFGNSDIQVTIYKK